MAASPGKSWISSKGCARPLPDTEDEETGERSGPRFYGRRHGRPLRAGRQDLLESLLPRLAIEKPERGSLDTGTLFPHPVDAIWLEIGFGAGEHLAWQAAHHPRIGFIGCEVFVNGIASLLDHVNRGGLDNVRIFPDDARLLFPYLADRSIAKVFVLFPDPWPKKGHIERRFIGPSNLDILSRLMNDGAELRLATDDPGLKEWMQEQMALRADFIPLSPPESEREDWPQTRYEIKARRQNREPLLLRFRRADRA